MLILRQSCNALPTSYPTTTTTTTIYLVFFLYTEERIRNMKRANEFIANEQQKPGESERRARPSLIRLIHISLERCLEQSVFFELSLLIPHLFWLDF